jgi:hypothetical protein
MRSAADRRGFFAAIATAAAGLVAMRSAVGAKTYRYRCPKCKLIQEYGTPGLRKCPNDGATMIRQG